jgi:hypothetical protein
LYIFIFVCDKFLLESLYSTNYLYHCIYLFCVCDHWKNCLCMWLRHVNGAENEQRKFSHFSLRLSKYSSILTTEEYLSLFLHILVVFVENHGYRILIKKNYFSVTIMTIVWCYFFLFIKEKKTNIFHVLLKNTNTT